MFRRISVAAVLIGISIISLFVSPLLAQDKKGAKDRPVATYRAVQDDKKVTITAEGSNNTGGWKNELKQLPMEIFPPQFKFTQTRPTGPATQAFRPFSVSVSFDAAAPVDHILVSDSAGQHKVAVKKMP